MSDIEKNPPNPLEVIRTNVSPVEVGKSYLKAELGKLFSEKECERVVDGLDKKAFWRLLEAMSFTYRLNGVFWTVGNDRFSWNEECWGVDNLTLTGINPTVNKVIYSKKVNRSPIAFRDFLLGYFAKHTMDDPRGLNQFRPDPRPIVHARILLREEEGQILLLDGTNRLVKMVLQGAEKITAYIARETNPRGKMRIGDSTFMLLRHLYRRASKEEQPAILETVKILADEGVDGYEAVKSYWVEHVMNDDQKKVGEELLKKLRDG